VSDDRIGRYQIGIFTLCGACLIMDGFDVQANRVRRAGDHSGLEDARR
jgi:hypothetical protein